MPVLLHRGGGARADRRRALAALAAPTSPPAPLIPPGDVMCGTPARRPRRTAGEFFQRTA
ncbi:hypothetical protein OHA09_32575 [Streptomyces longwoodensis]|uniref:hypothetical protein n=1 Tax=Streptomyces longwoodensis TaxID=68231 RepID=UPI002E824210|nr:hypothetical protein [Streptomyces longwoodensis]WUC61499.1 hypothetical protein OHA09_32575 [Streptomyces longwoodensis]